MNSIFSPEVIRILIVVSFTLFFIDFFLRGKLKENKESEPLKTAEKILKVILYAFFFIDIISVIASFIF